MLFYLYIRVILLNSNFYSFNIKIYSISVSIKITEMKEIVSFEKVSFYQIKYYDVTKF